MADDPPKTALADRSSGILTVTCPHCEFRNEFPGWDEMDIFICDQCGDPVQVEEPTQ